mmetsp:Transcript_20163/g.51305  ORF Transcript_20163/g.51305 Transcript_20163/m.51305 type:complete len:229 (+) Transcript_20163:183-869(+)
MPALLAARRRPARAAATCRAPVARAPPPSLPRRRCSSLVGPGITLLVLVERVVLLALGRGLFFSRAFPRISAEEARLRLLANLLAVPVDVRGLRLGVGLVVCLGVLLPLDALPPALGPLCNLLLLLPLILLPLLFLLVVVFLALSLSCELDGLVAPRALGVACSFLRLLRGCFGLGLALNIRLLLALAGRLAFAFVLCPLLELCDLLRRFSHILVVDDVSLTHALLDF